MPIDFLDLLAERGWVRAAIVPEATTSTWADGGTLDDAGIDVATTFSGASRSTGLDPTFGLHGVRLVAGFEGPFRRHDQPVLMLVFDGELVIASADAGEVRIGEGQFCVVEEGTQHAVSAGPDGVTYTECWPQDVESADTCWYPGDAWALG